MTNTTRFIYAPINVLEPEEYKAAEDLLLSTKVFGTKVYADEDRVWAIWEESKESFTKEEAREIFDLTMRKSFAHLPA